jgi:hypothetical protein
LFVQLEAYLKSDDEEVAEYFSFAFDNIDKALHRAYLLHQSMGYNLFKFSVKGETDNWEYFKLEFAQ